MPIPSGHTAADVLYTLLSGGEGRMRTAPSGSTVEDLLFSLLVAVRSATLVGGGGITVPDQTGHNGEFLSTDGVELSWQAAPEGEGALPSQSGNGGKYLTTDGSSPSWVTILALPSPTDHANTFLKNIDGSNLEWANISEFALAADLDGFLDAQLTANDSFTASISSLTSGKVSVGDIIGSGLTMDTGYIVGRVSGGSGGVEGLTASQVLDLVGSAAQGSLLYRGATGWAVSPAGNAGEVFTSAGAGNNPGWAAGGGLPSQTGNSGKILSTNGTTASWTTVAAALEAIGSTRGQILIRSTSGWIALSPGTSGYALKTNGAGADPSWQALAVASGAGTGSVVWGSGCTASGSYAVAAGFGCTATKDMSAALGTHASGEVYSALHLSGGRHSTTGDSLTIIATFRNVTTNTTPTTLFANGSSERFVVTANTVATCLVMIAAKQSGSTNCASFWRRVTICRDGSGNTALVGTVEVIGTDIASGWSVAITADDTNEALKIEVTGASGVTITWTATILITKNSA